MLVAARGCKLESYKHYLHVGMWQLYINVRTEWEKKPHKEMRYQYHLYLYSRPAAEAAWLAKSYN